MSTSADVRCHLLPRAELSPEQLALVQSRLDAPEHIRDWLSINMPHSWRSPATNVAVAILERDTLIGLAEASGTWDRVNAGWWIDYRYRRQGYGYELVDLLADHLMGLGYRAVGPITVLGEDYEGSKKLRARFVQRFTGRPSN